MQYSKKQLISNALMGLKLKLVLYREVKNSEFFGAVLGKVTLEQKLTPPVVKISASRLKLTLPAAS
jgi:hypothetical protein